MNAPRGYVTDNLVVSVPPLAQDPPIVDPAASRSVRVWRPRSCVAFSTSMC